MGKTQVGQSTLIQYIKNYMDPNHAIDRALLEKSILSPGEVTKVEDAERMDFSAW